MVIYISTIGDKTFDLICAVGALLLAVKFLAYLVRSDPRALARGTLAVTERSLAPLPQRLISVQLARFVRALVNAFLFQNGNQTHFRPSHHALLC